MLGRNYCIEEIHFWKTVRLFHCPLFISTSWFLILAEAFRNDHVAVCSTALEGANEKNEMGRYGTNRSVFVQNDMAL